jgi:hypothetical protein
MKGYLCECIGPAHSIEYEDEFDILWDLVSRDDDIPPFELGVLVSKDCPHLRNYSIVDETEHLMVIQEWDEWTGKMVSV